MANAGRAPKVHRATALACSGERPPGITAGDAGTAEACQIDADCTQGRNGRCQNSRPGLRCSYDGCLADADCTGRAVCECDSWMGANTCLASSCRIDSDCGAGGYCSPSQGDCGNYAGIVTYACHTAADECIDDEDCQKEPGSTCRFVPAASRWKCSSSQCVGALHTGSMRGLD